MIAQSFFYERSCMQKEKLQLAGAFIDLLPFELAITKFTNNKNFVIKAGFFKSKREV